MTLIPRIILRKLISVIRDIRGKERIVAKKGTDMAIRSNNSQDARRKALVLVVLVAAHVVLVLGSWLWSAAMPESPVRSLLSESGIRWFFGTFVANLASPLIVWMVLLDLAVGACSTSGLWAAMTAAVSRNAAIDSRQRSGLRAALGLMIIEVAVVCVLVVPRHAILLSATGNLFPSSFSVSIVPVSAFVVLTCAITFGLFSGSLHNYQDVAKCAVDGGRNLKFILAVYVLAMELWCVARYAFLL